MSNGKVYKKPKRLNIGTTELIIMKQSCVKKLRDGFIQGLPQTRQAFMSFLESLNFKQLAQVDSVQVEVFKGQKGFQRNNCG